MVSFTEHVLQAAASQACVKTWQVGGKLLVSSCCACWRLNMPCGLAMLYRTLDAHYLELEDDFKVSENVSVCSQSCTCQIYRSCCLLMMHASWNTHSVHYWCFCVPMVCALRNALRRSARSFAAAISITWRLHQSLASHINDVTSCIVPGVMSYCHTCA